MMMKMKKNIIALGLIVAATFALTNCTKEIENPADGQESAGIPFELIASTADTKTAAGDDLATVWVSNDALSVFHAEAGSTEYGENDKFSITTEELASGKFTGTLSAALEAGKSYDWYAVYPYKDSYKTPATTNSGVIYLGSKYNEVQKQDGNDDMSHLAGANFPLYGKAKGLKAASVPVISMSHLTSVIELTVTNNTSEALTINNIAFTAPEAIIGGYYISIAGEDVVYTGNGQYVNATATLNVDAAAALASGKSAKFYIGFKPFVAKAGDVLKMAVNGYEKEVTLSKDMTFHPGKIKALSFDFDKIPVQSIPYNESFTESQGLFTVKDVSLGNLSYVWSADTKNKCMKATAYNGSENAAESWLVSPNIDLTGASSAYVSFEHAGNYFADVETMKKEVKVKVRKNEGEWADLSINYPESMSWTFIPSGSVSLASYVGGNVQVAFVYTSTASKAGTWEIRNFKVTAKQDQFLSFSAETASATIGEEFTEPVLNGAKTTVSYSSSNPSVATVAADGSVSLVAAGETVITAAAEENSEYFGGSASYKLMVVDASTLYVFATPKSSSNTAYANVFDVAIGDITWSVPGNQNNDGFVRIGGKSLDNVTRVIYGKGAVTGGVKSVVMETNGISNDALVVHSVVCKVYSTAAGAAAGTTDGLVATVTNTDADWAKSTPKTITFANSSATAWTDCYYRFEFTFSNEKTSNYGIDLCKILFNSK